MRAELCPQGVHGDIPILQMDKLSFKEGMWSLYCHTVTDYGSSPSPVNRNWIQAKQETQARLCWGLCGSRREQNQTTASLACWLWRREWVCSLCGVRVEVCPGVRPKGWRVCVCVCVCVVGMPSILFCSRHTVFILQALQNWQLGFVVSFCFLGPAFAPTEHAHSYF